LRTLAIIGAGFSGTVLTANLLGSDACRDTRIVLIERSGRFGRGVAYAPRHFPYLLNVPAERMSARSAEPDQFLDFARRRFALTAGSDFLPRELYGDYLEEFLANAQVRCHATVSLQCLSDEVLRIDPQPRGFALQLAKGDTICADAVVLAIGNPPPSNLRETAGAQDHPGYIGNPWTRELAFTATETIMTIGTGLTMADVIGAATRGPQGVARIHALSRHGLIPPTQTSFRPNVHACNTETLKAAGDSVRKLVKATRRLSRESEFMGGDWREVVTTARLVAPHIWQHLPLPQRQRFLRHVRSYWDIHRHRLPPNIRAGIETLQSTGKLQVHAGRLTSVQPQGARLAVSFHPRAQRAVKTVLVDKLINCTGPDYAPHRSRDTLIRNLLEQGLILPDDLRLGIRTGPHRGVLDAQGRTVPGLFLLGPMLRADHWEATAANELRNHAEDLAQHLTAALSDRDTPPRLS
jgi:uncharacterized NAD(P)/FAD-binding protein YdhS